MVKSEEMRDRKISINIELPKQTKKWKNSENYEYMHHVRMLIVVHDGQRLTDRKSDYKTITILSQLKMSGFIRYRFFIIFTSSFPKHRRFIIANRDWNPKALQVSASLNAFHFCPFERYVNLPKFIKSQVHTRQ